MRFLILFTVFFSVYGAANYYVYVRGRSVLPAGSWGGSFFVPVFLFVVLAFPAGRFLEGAWLGPPATVLIWIGSLWLACMVYFVILLGLLDLGRFIGGRLGWLGPPGSNTGLARYAAVLVCATVLLVVAVGFVNSRFPRIQSYDIQLDLRGRPRPTLPNPLVLTLATDIHLGTTLGPSGLDRIVRMINSTDPDLVILGGDIVDEDMGPVLERDMGEKLLQLQSRLGVFAVTGNHEYIGGAERACAYLTNHGVRILRDEWFDLGGLMIVGREDRSIRSFTDRTRASLDSIVKQARPSGPILLLDHQPFDLQHAQEAGVDLQLSGHTHHGQLWPFSLITRAIYEKDWGHLRKGTTQYYVSCGAGTWGPPVRTTSRPEIVVLRLTFR